MELSLYPHDVQVLAGQRDENILAFPVRSQNIFNDFHLFVFIASSLSHVRRWFYLCNSEYQNIRRNISLLNNIIQTNLYGLIHFKENQLVVECHFVSYNTWSPELTFTKILNKSQMQRISLTWPQHQQSNKMGNIGREKLILRWGKIYALDHHHKRSKKPFIWDI